MATEGETANVEDTGTSIVRRIILLLIFFLIFPSLLYYYLVLFLVPLNPHMRLDSVAVERSPVTEETEVTKWSLNLTIHNPDKRWIGNYRDVKFKLLMKEEDAPKAHVIGMKNLEPFSLKCAEGLQVVLNMEVIDRLEDEEFEEERFALRMYLKASYVDSHNSFVGDYWDIRRECADLRFKVMGGKGELMNSVPTWCEDRVLVVPHRRILSNAEVDGN